LHQQLALTKRKQTIYRSKIKFQLYKSKFQVGTFILNLDFFENAIVFFIIYSSCITFLIFTFSWSQ
jgi:hypothetical protein